MEEGAREVEKYTDGPRGLLFCMDCSNLDSGRTETSVAWRDPEWNTRKTYLDIDTEVFTAEQFAIEEALRIEPKGRQTKSEASRQQMKLLSTKIAI